MNIERLEFLKELLRIEQQLSMTGCFFMKDVDDLCTLIEKEIRLIGFDYYTIEELGTHQNVHKKILENNVILIEGLNLFNIETGEYELIALPLKIKTRSYSLPSINSHFNLLYVIFFINGILNLPSNSPIVFSGYSSFATITV